MDSATASHAVIRVGGDDATPGFTLTCIAVDRTPNAQLRLALCRSNGATRRPICSFITTWRGMELLNDYLTGNGCEPRGLPGKNDLNSEGDLLFQITGTECTLTFFPCMHGAVVVPCNALWDLIDQALPVRTATANT